MSIKSLLALVPALLLLACGGPDASSPRPEPAQTQVSAGRAAKLATKADYHKLVQSLYVGYFGRPADPGGLDFYAGQYLAIGAPTTLAEARQAYIDNPAVRLLVDSFGSSAESHALHPGDSAAFISAIYANLFNREPDPGGKAFWIGALDSGAISRASAAMEIMHGAQGDDVAIVDAKVQAASSFTSALNTPSRVAVYSGKDAIALVRAMLARAGLDTDQRSFVSDVTLTIDALLAASTVSVVDAVTPDHAIAGKPLVLSISGINLPADLVVKLDGCAGIAEAAGGSMTLRVFACVPSLAGNLTGSVRKLDGVLLAALAINVFDTAYQVPVVTDVTPLTALTGELTTFTVTGTDLLNGIVLEVDDCVFDGIDIAGGTNTQRQFACKALTNGKKWITVKSLLGEQLFSVMMIVSDPAPGAK